MPFGVSVLLILAVLVYFGVLHRVLDRMRLDDRTALLILFLMIVGSFFNLTILRRPVLAVNVGGAIIPLGVVIYLIVTADTARERVRGTMAAVISGAVIYGAMKLLNPEEQTMIIEPTYFFAVVAAVVGYLSGRSRRSSFIGGTAGIILADVGHYVEITVRGIRGQTWIGGAGIFDAVVIAGVLAVVLAELVGETREFMARGSLESGRGGGRSAGRTEGSPEAEGGGPEAALGVSGGRRSEESGTRGRGADAERRRRGGGRAKVRPTTTGGAGWEPPLVGEVPSGQESIGSIGAPPPELGPTELGASAPELAGRRVQDARPVQDARVIQDAEGPIVGGEAGGSSAGGSGPAAGRRKRGGADD